ncbi:membrane protein [Arthrobacter phage Orcanus]|nr:membrane protein [Arthrobacter phage Orcanus]
MARLPWYSMIMGRIAEPSAITALQILSHFTAASAGGLVIMGAFPYLFRGIISPVMAFGVGLILAVGGAIGVASCWRGVWWLERVALMLVGLGWVLLVPSVLAIHLTGLVKSFLLLMLAVAVFDVAKRYRRIDWAYLDPTK